MTLEQWRDEWSYAWYAIGQAVRWQWVKGRGAPNYAK